MIEINNLFKIFCFKRLKATPGSVHEPSETCTLRGQDLFKPDTDWDTDKINFPKESNSCARPA